MFVLLYLSVSIKKNINFSKNTYMLLVSASTRNLKSLILSDSYSTSFKVSLDSYVSFNQIFTKSQEC